MPGRRDRRRPDGARARSAARPAVRLRRGRARSREALDGSLLRARLQRARQDRERSFAQEYLSYFLNDEPSPGIEYEYRLVQQLLPDDHARRRRRRWRAHAPRRRSRVVLAVDAAEGQACKVPPEADLRAALTAADTRRRHAVDRRRTTTRALIEKPAATGARRPSRREIRRPRRHRRAFSNGVEAWLKPTDFKNDQVLFTMYAPGGASLAPPDDFLQASFATRYVGLSGVGGIKALDLEKLLAGKLASASPFVSLVDARHLTDRRRPRSSKRRCSCSTWTSRHRATTPRRSRC